MMTFMLIEFTITIITSSEDVQVVRSWMQDQRHHHEKNEFSAGSKQIQVPLAQSRILTTQDASQPALWGGSLGGGRATPQEESPWAALAVGSGHPDTTVEQSSLQGGGLKDPVGMKIATRIVLRSQSSLLPSLPAHPNPTYLPRFSSGRLRNRDCSHHRHQGLTTSVNTLPVLQFMSSKGKCNIQKHHQLKSKLSQVMFVILYSHLLQIHRP